jgi:hypothetical protein
MAKNSKGQKVSNKKYYKKSTTNTNKKKSTKVNSSKTKKTTKRTYNKKPKKLENNVSIIVDNTKESLNYNILEEPIEADNKVKYKQDKKIKTQFKDENEDTKFLLLEDIKEEEKEYFEEPVIASAEEETEDELPVEEEPVVEEKIEEEVKEEDLPQKIEDEVEEQEKVNEEIPEKPEEVVEEAHEEEPVVEEKIEAEKINPDDLEKYILHYTQELKAINEDSDIYNNEDVDLPDDVKRYSTNGSFVKFVIRLVVLFLLIIFSIYSIISFSMRYVDNNNVNNIAFHELSSVDYELCTKNKCVPARQITNKNDGIKINYQYEMDFDEKITYEANYTIVAELSIINKEKNNNVVATDKSIIIKKDINGKDNEELIISQDIEVELDKYRNKLKEYNTNNNTKYDGQLEVVMYVDGINEKERVASIEVPMDNGVIDTQEISYNQGDASIENSKVSSSKLYLYLIIGSFIVLLGSCIAVLFLLHSPYDTYEN